ncbi:MAG TPA: hypothetical protein P5205_15530 [Candidatus Paceibacterota bacterium]|nr:hypothetical protein [Verrucomicrobiota bacterium]HSA11771.1 hypothetical protein [Candidatus Paceibacterota bacterium]
MRVQGLKWYGGAAVLLIVLALVVWRRSRGTDPGGSALVSSNALPQEVTSPAGAAGAAGGAKAELGDQLRAAKVALANASDAAGKQQALAVLRQALLGGSANDTAAAIRQLLDSKADAPTGQGFKVGGGGSLTEAPTLRTFLLDQLGRLDPAAAAAYARIILSRMDSPDEWAVALRSLAVGDTSPSGRALLGQKIAELLRYEPWQRDPSVGYLEAFDAAVFLGDTNLAPALADLVRRQDNSAVSHAAYLALDRMIINDASQLLSALEAAPEMMQGREATRADYFARADVRDPQQRQVLESYLLAPGRSAAELAQFAGVFPNANYMISHNLLTSTPTPDRAALTSRDAASLQVVQEWLADPRFAKLQRPLQKVKQRLEDFARQSSR